MARKSRVEYAGAIYHVVNRGNFRTWIFETEGAQEAFELCLSQACKRSGWLLHAYVLMGNHYHLAIETPEPNLVSGMHWLEATFANRFNRFRGEHGHLFQGRYKAILVEPGSDGLGRLCDYITLNPCRAGLCDVDGLAHYKRSLYWRLLNPELREDFMQPHKALLYAGGMPDSPEGWAAYARHLQARLASWRQLKDSEVISLSQGWVIGSQAFAEQIAKTQQPASQVRHAGASSAREARQINAQEAFEKCLKVLGKSECSDPAASALWKIAVACAMKKHSSVSNGWLAEKLEMNSGKYVSRLVCDPKYRQRIPESMQAQLDVIWAT